MYRTASLLLADRPAKCRLDLVTKSIIVQGIVIGKTLLGLVDFYFWDLVLEQFTVRKLTTLGTIP